MKQQSPKTFTELKLNNTEGNRNEGKVDKKGSARKSPARKSPRMSPSSRTPVRVRIQRMENKVQKVKMKPTRPSTPKARRKTGKEMDQDPNQRKIQDFLCKSQPRAENPPP